MSFSSPTKLSFVILAILVLFLYSISPADDTMVFMGFVCVQVAPIMAFVMIYEICSSRRARDRTRSTSTNYLSCCDELHHYVPSSEACPIRRRLQEQRHQVALLNRESYEFENFTLRELHSAFSVFGIPYMNEEEINALYVRKCKGIGLESEDAPPTQALSSSASAKEFWKILIMDEDDELTCNICLEQVRKGHLFHSLPCLHQFHSKCIDPWLGLNACPICNMSYDEMV